MQEILPILGGLLTGAGIVALINWLRFRNVDAAEADTKRADADKKRAEAQSALHDSDTNALTISTGLLAVWMKDASEAQKIIVQKETELQKLQRKSDHCEDELEKQKQKHPEDF